MTALRTVLGLTIVAGLFIPAAQASDLVVVEARGINLAQGAVIDDTQPLVLKEGQQVTLIASNGSIMTVRGPFDKPPVSEASSGVDVDKALAALTTKDAARTNVAGVVRSANEDVHLPGPWLVDVSHSGNACLREGDTPVFWRASDAGGATLTIMPTDRSWRAKADWPGKSATMQAPSNFPIKDGRTYLTDFGGKPAAVTLNAIPKAVSSDRMQAAWMLEKGCVAQAEALLKTVR